MTANAYIRLHDAGFCSPICRECALEAFTADLSDRLECDRPVFMGAVRRWVACGQCDRCLANPDLDTEAR